MPETSLCKPLGVFGGTFDPVHFGHLRLAEAAADSLGLEAVRWIPAGRPVLRDAPRVSAGQRLEMVRLAIAGNPRFELDTSEIDAAQLSYTVPTLERLRLPEVCGKQRPLVLLVGADAFSGLTGWHRWESLLDLAHIAVAHRPGYPVEADNLPAPLSGVFRERYCDNVEELSATPAGRVVCFSMTQLDISATRIRNLLSKGHSTRYLLPDAVISHIQNHHFYLEN
ncbi:MAG: nicotinate-nucleotide adenylyltransferase [Betaproteobacteria bacterium]